MNDKHTPGPWKVQQGNCSPWDVQTAEHYSVLEDLSEPDAEEGTQ